MSGFMEFAEILAGKLQQETTAKCVHVSPELTSSSTELDAVSTEYAHLAWLLGHTPKHTACIPTASMTPYKAYKPAPKPKPQHKLSAEQLQAFQLLHSHCPELDLSFTARDLKHSYRKALLATHPDQGGSLHKLQSAQNAYQVLLVLVKST